MSQGLDREHHNVALASPYFCWWMATFYECHLLNKPVTADIDVEGSPSEDCWIWSRITWLRILVIAVP